MRIVDLFAVDRYGKILKAYEYPSRTIHVPFGETLIRLDDGDFVVFDGDSIISSENTDFLNDFVSNIYDHLSNVADRADADAVNVNDEVSVEFFELSGPQIAMIITINGDSENAYIIEYEQFTDYRAPDNPIPFIDLSWVRIFSMVRNIYYRANNLWDKIDDIMMNMSDYEIIYPEMIHLLSKLKSNPKSIASYPLRYRSTIQSMEYDFIEYIKLLGKNAEYIENLSYLVYELTEIIWNSSLYNAPSDDLCKFAESIGINTADVSDKRDVVYEILKKTDIKFKSYAEVYETVLKKIQLSDIPVPDQVIKHTNDRIDEIHRRAIRYIYECTNSIMSALIKNSPVSEYVDSYARYKPNIAVTY